MKPTRKIEISKAWLDIFDAPQAVRDLWKKKKEINPRVTIEALIKKGKYSMASWVLVRALNRKNKVKYALYALELTIKAFEARYPDDHGPKKAVQTGKEALNTGIREAKEAAFNAGKETFGNYTAVAYMAADYQDGFCYSDADISFDSEAIDEVIAYAVPYIAADIAEKKDTAVFLEYQAQKEILWKKIIYFGLSLL
jgi:hypothetical protein